MLFFCRRVAPWGSVGTVRPATGATSMLPQSPRPKVLNPDTLGSGGLEGRYP